MSIIGSLQSYPASGVIADFIDFIHDPLCPMNARGNQLVRPGASLWTTEQIIGSFHVQAGKNRRHDPEHSFASFVHFGSLADSLCIRLAVISKKSRKYKKLKRI